MKTLIKGLLLGLCMNILNRICEFVFQGMNFEYILIWSSVIFGLVITAFLVSDSIPQLFACGFTGFFTMIISELFIFNRLLPSQSILPYVGGFVSSVPAVVVAIILTSTHFKLSNYLIKLKDEINMTKFVKLKLIVYTVISAIGFSYLVLPQSSGIGVVVFCLLQFAMLWFVTKNKKRLFLFVPIFFMSLNCFISASTIWRIPNFIVSVILFGCMFLDINFKDDTFKFITDTLYNIMYAFSRFMLPFKWLLEINSDKTSLIKRIVTAVAIALPCGFILIVILANADMVFSIKTESFFDGLLSVISGNTLFKCIIGIVMGLFLFGIVYNSYHTIAQPTQTQKQYKGDLVIINILISTILVIYTLFVAIQFKYLFAGSTLPDGLTYTQYARKGFFELLALTGVNIAAILTVTKLTKNHTGGWLKFSKVLCHYLCIITIVLLVSSFYRMFLYTNDDGLTRLRFFVMGFLIFEAIGLVITFIYIYKPKFNIVLVYTVLALSYYAVLNIVPADNIIAKNQIGKYLDGTRNDVDYIFTLSADAVPAMEYLYNNTDDEQVKNQITKFIKDKTESQIPTRWQRFNLSVSNAKKSGKH